MSLGTNLISFPTLLFFPIPYPFILPFSLPLHFLFSFLLLPISLPFSLCPSFPHAFPYFPYPSIYFPFLSFPFPFLLPRLMSPPNSLILVRQRYSPLLCLPLQISSISDLRGKLLLRERESLKMGAIISLGNIIISIIIIIIYLNLCY